jgi:hypothetical protein
MSVKGAADILGCNGSNDELVDRVLQNLHPQVRSHLIFTEKPRTFSDLFILASAVAEAVVIEKQRRSALRGRGNMFNMFANVKKFGITYSVVSEQGTMSHGRWSSL